MIVILCDTFYDACEAFLAFWEYVEIGLGENITNVWKSENCLETDDDLRYIFIDYRWLSAFLSMKPDVLDVEEFFEGLPHWKRI